MLNQKRHLDYADDEGRDDDLDAAVDENSIEEVDKKDPDDGLHLEWEMTDWSRCSQTCGPNGKQVGKIQNTVENGYCVTTLGPGQNT